MMTTDEIPKESGGRVMKPCDIPIYGFPDEQKQQTAAKSESEPAAAAEQATGALRSGIKTARLAVQEVVGPLRAFEESAKNIYQTGKAHSASTYDQLLQPENAPMRAAFIGTGGLLGYMLGAIRGRFFRKLFYSGIGIAATSAACYPKEANQLSSEALEEGKRLGNIAANFVKGAQPDSAGVADTEEKTSRQTDIGQVSGQQVVASRLFPILRTVRQQVQQLQHLAPLGFAQKDSNAEMKTATEKAKDVTSNQSNPADKDMYTTRDGDK